MTNPAPNRFARNSATGAPCLNGNLILRRVFHTRDDVGGIARPNNAEWLDLVNAGVTRIELQEQIIAAHFAVECPS